MGVELSDCADIESCLTISNDRLDNLEAEVDVLDGKQITEDFHYINSDKIELEKGVRNTLYEWTVKAGETMDLEVHFDTDQDRINQNNSVKLVLFMDGDVVMANSQDDGDGGDDNSV